jgi:hypothetical protein
MSKNNINNIEKRLNCMASFNQINSLEMLIPEDTGDLDKDPDIQDEKFWFVFQKDDEEKV